MIPQNINGLRYYQSERFPAGRVLNAVFTRLGGVSASPFASLNLGITVGDNREAVQENRKRFYAAVAVDPHTAVRTIQVHGARVAAVGPSDVAKMQKDTDGLVTDTPNLPLVMAFADCTPIMLYDPVRQVVGIAHAGWRGTVAGVCQAAVRQMVNTFNCRPADIQAAIGPAIGPCCYEVGDEVVTAAEAAFGPCDELFKPGKVERAHFDQWAANELALRRAGVTQIEQARICTSCHVDEFFSHRAEAGRTGRFGAIIMLREASESNQRPNAHD